MESARKERQRAHLCTRPTSILGIECPCARQILDDVAKRFIYSDLFWRTPAFDVARQHLTNFSNDMFIIDQVGSLGPKELGSLLPNALVWPSR